MGRIKRGWELTKKSWGILKSNRSLLRFPLFGGVLSLILGALFLAPGVYFLDEDRYGAGIPLIVVGVYVLAFIGIYFSVGLAATANRIYQGQEGHFSDGISVANSRLPQIAGWALLSTIVGLILNAIANRGGVAGAIVGRLLDIGWSLITFLAVPVIAIEGPGPIQALKRSSHLFRDRWGQQVTGNLAIGGAAILFGTIPGVALIALGFVLWGSSGIIGGVLVGLGVLIIAIAALIASALKGVFGVALYHYASEGEAVGGFTAGDFESAVGRGGGVPRPATGTV